MLNLVYKVTKLIAFIIVHLVGWQNTNIPIIVYICPIGFKISSEKPVLWMLTSLQQSYTNKSN